MRALLMLPLAIYTATGIWQSTQTSRGNLDATKLAPPIRSPCDPFQSVLDLGEFPAFVLDKLGVNLIVG